MPLAGAGATIGNLCPRAGVGYAHYGQTIGSGRPGTSRCRIMTGVVSGGASGSSEGGRRGRRIDDGPQGQARPCAAPKLSESSAQATPHHSLPLTLIITQPANPASHYKTPLLLLARRCPPLTPSTPNCCLSAIASASTTDAARPLPPGLLLSTAAAPH